MSNNGQIIYIQESNFVSEKEKPMEQQSAHILHHTQKRVGPSDCARITIGWQQYYVVRDSPVRLYMFTAIELSAVRSSLIRFDTVCTELYLANYTSRHCTMVIVIM